MMAIAFRLNPRWLVSRATDAEVDVEKMSPFELEFLPCRSVLSVVRIPLKQLIR